MEKISFAEARSLAEKKGLKPGKVSGTERVQFTRGASGRVEVIGWEEFETTLERRKLAIYQSGGFLKVMEA